MAARATAFGRLAAAARAALSPQTRTGAARYSSYRTTPFAERVAERPPHERVSEPAEWGAVERLLFARTVPEPAAKPDYPSGWRPQSADAADNPYFVSRNRNHMVPVHLLVAKRGFVKITAVKKVRGDVWRLRDELVAHLLEKRGIRVASRVHEMAGKVQIKGDHYYDVRQFVLDKGM